VIIKIPFICKNVVLLNICAIYTCHLCETVSEIISKNYINNQDKKDQSLKGFNLFKSIHLANDKRWIGIFIITWIAQMLSKTTFLQIKWKSDDSCHACRNNCPWKVNVVPCYGVFGCWLENCYRYLITVTCKNDQQTSPWKFLWNQDDQCTSKKKIK
jgi:hypothetical protein